MNEAYLREFSDDRIERLLFRKENLPHLEAIVESDQRRWRQLSASPNASEQGGRVNQVRALDLFSAVREEVDGILGVSGLPPPMLQGTRLLSRQHTDIVATFAGGLACVGASATLLAWRTRRSRPLAGHISPGPISRRRLVAALTLMISGGCLIGKGVLAEQRRLNDAGYVATGERIEFPLGRKQVQTELLMVHEYVHHIQKLKGFYPRKDLALTIAIEGHARGVERIWTKHRTLSGKGAVYERYQLSLRSNELPRIYLALCDHFAVPPREELLGQRTAASLRAAKPDLRWYGYALFRIHELTVGQGIYRDMIHGALTIQGP